MPIYLYRCSKCNNDFEYIQKFSDDPETTCTECGTETLEKQLTRPAAPHFKGGGWANDGYGSKKKAEPGLVNTTEGVMKGEEIHQGLMEAADKGPQAAQEFARKTGGSMNVKVEPEAK